MGGKRDMETLNELLDHVIDKYGRVIFLNSHSMLAESLKTDQMYLIYYGVSYKGDLLANYNIESVSTYDLKGVDYNV